jgi:hypothetical protein
MYPLKLGNVIFLLTLLGTLVIAGFAVSSLLLAIGNIMILKGKKAQSGINAFPALHYPC